MRNGLHFALLGENIKYSKSPAIFEAVFRSLGREGQFEAVSVRKEDLRGSLNQLVLEGVRGFAVTIPYKQDIIRCLDDIDPVAHKVGAVNAVTVEESNLYGFNTDCHGFASPLVSLGKRAIGAKALIAGCGGAARAVAYSLCHDFCVHDLTILGRSAEKLAQFQRTMEAALERTKIRTESDGGALSQSEGEFDIVVNCTPLGGWHYSEQSPFPKNMKLRNDSVYYDLNYNEGNRLVAWARRQRVLTLDGSAMLVAQALKSFTIWTDIQVPFGDIYRAVFGTRESSASV